MIFPYLHSAATAHTNTILSALTARATLDLARLIPLGKINVLHTLVRPPSGSDHALNRSSKFHLSDLLAKLNPSSSSFRCHSPFQSNTLSDFSILITDVLRNYRDELFGGKDDSERMTFETCNAGYKSTEVSPAIYFSKMTTRQITKVKPFLEIEVINRFPDMKLVVESNVLAIVQKTGEKLKRRNTI